MDYCNAAEYRPTPLLQIKIMQENDNAFTFSTLPDTGSTKAVLARDTAERNGVKWDPTYDGTLTDAQGKQMNVSGVAYIKVRAKNVNGDLNKHGEFHMIPCLISSTLKNEKYLSWRDLQLLGSISPYFPEVWTEKNT